MAIKMTANYSKRLGLPGYSSHQFEVCVETEISSIDDVAGESSRLYQTLQQSVDEEIQHTGFVPKEGYGNGNGTKSNGARTETNGNGNGQWQCSDKQRDLIIKLIEEHNLDKAEIENLALERFDGLGVKQLNRIQASGLIDELFERVGEKQPARGRRSRNGGPPAYTNGGGR